MKTFIRIIVLAFFVGGIALFVAYRSGGFGGSKEVLPLDPNGTVVITSNGDTVDIDKLNADLKAHYDSMERLRMMSSKTVIMTDELWEALHKDSIQTTDSTKSK